MPIQRGYSMTCDICGKPFALECEVIAISPTKWQLITMAMGIGWEVRGKKTLCEKCGADGNNWEEDTNERN